MKDQKRDIENVRQLIQDDEIDLVEVAKTIWAGRKLILKVIAVFFSIGLLVAFRSKAELLIPGSQEDMKPTHGGSIQSLACRE